ncbi:hypothetical protein DFP75_103218 [Marinomonas alcarazii]|uniref:Uncharacterized protein n=1 Tax=Marinomonas alcarazii TaxID=491949 RepID=A0A318V3N7_9GAMM|nr:hypothetical protein DFP75_103218 [Marinomonas alcarazii]
MPLEIVLKKHPLNCAIFGFKIHVLFNLPHPLNFPSTTTITQAF